MKKIGIIGGGFMGMTLGHKLAKAGASVQVFERSSQVGGLATWEDYGSFTFDRFYHVILPGDQFLLDIIRDLGIEDRLVWQQTYTGYYVNEQFYDMSTSMDFLKFPPLGMFSKGRLALTILRGSRISDWKSMEQMTIEEWLVKIGGRNTFEKFWKPLLLAKLGENYKRVSAVFIWTYIKRLFEARDSSSAERAEHMGYVSGGYKTVFDAMTASVESHGGTIHTNAAVTQIEPAPEGGMLVHTEAGSTHFDKVIFTSPVNVLQKVAAPGLIEVQQDGREVEYLGVVCMVLKTTRSFTPYYVLNLADDKVPFTGVIGMSTLVDKADTGGYELTYFPKYVLSTDPILQKSDEELSEWFIQGVKSLYPDLKSEEIVEAHINRAFKVQPLQVLNYSDIVPKSKTLHPDMYVVNTSQFVNDTLNNNSVARHIHKFLEAHQKSLLSEQPETTHQL
ncbi:NAD(P)/FAD-dependent oxidoreductase [Pontibacter sp. G13]|uniref:NAD(P)/FAD-dependent oxidoreductase n=1 Tax=Pontibacter sp. G13 TaxID=3074898 RepID=UPI0028895965|nr:NAD(P)/FAD-dependent oxidoreductase [Pontibacter sp. G13]WNJ19771.1 NAD(P)/FAD-dependent oxidoreductase [Pontibacter sp. G13]